MNTANLRSIATRTEILSQPDVWAATLSDLETRSQHFLDGLSCVQGQETLFVGCGSTHYVALSLASAAQQVRGLRARGAPASEVCLFPRQVLADAANTCLVAVSRSGATTETLRAIEAYRKAGGAEVLGVTCYGDSPLVRMCDFCLVTREAHEQSVAQTRSLTTMLLAGLFGIGVAAGDPDLLGQLRRLPPAAQTVLDEHLEPAEWLGKRLGLGQVFFLGSGPLYGVASEAMLKLKEMSLTVSQAFHSLEFRHGPISMVDQATLVVGLLSQAALAEELAVLRETKALGATVLALVPAEQAAACHGLDRVIPLPEGFSDQARLPLYLPPLQWLALTRALTKGLNPDRPRHLEAVVYLRETKRHS
jgi:glucosamine--fructose-6-phosphate aminotransferase (isomerizing)